MKTEKDEPVAWLNKSRNLLSWDKVYEDMDALYTYPKEWVGLNDAEKAQFVVTYYPSNWDRKTAVSLMSNYEKYLKEKNT